MDELIDINTLFGALPSASTDLTLDLLLDLLTKHNVRAACTLSTLGFLLDPAAGNAATRAACAENPALVPAATLNPTTYTGGAEGLASLRTDGYRLIRFFPCVQGWPMMYGPFRELITALAPIELPLGIDIARTGDITGLQTALSAWSGTVILMGVDISTLPEALCALRANRAWHMDTSRLLACGAIKAVVDTVGADRLLYGSGAPNGSLASIRNVLQAAGLSGDAMRAVRAGNAARLLKL